MSKSVGAVDYTSTEIDAALTTLAYYGGNAARAAIELGIPHSTLKLWRARTHRDRYLEIAEREGPRLEQIAAQQAREVILRAGEAEHSLLDLLNARMADESAPEPQKDDFPNETLYLLAYEQWVKRGSSKELSELAGTLQRVTTAKGINGTKLLELTGRPTQIVQHLDPKQAAMALARRLGVSIESTATEIHGTPLLAESGSPNVREADHAAQSPLQPPD